MSEKKIAGTPRIVIGAVLIAWGFFAGIYGLGSSEGGGPFPGLILLGLGVWSLIVGLNARRRSLSR
ncbi:hypothetical protein [Rathayibacter sp. VKM Ac-2630]|uniref:hypothetical protein n=1 Tax=Rathayibacter sp. VKM Ac-2630 TaxID=1938617 RepID=UPI000982313A|nr:hypothetical protein [Rathayibacter sp. VKM Ac-2630]OOB90329.1 hypothetical protein B0T42_12590 [Rathayibacter sp. VKM Ac-2630]